jgi:alkyl sulfatase BDS1-like metallo-beta-lactamase superfamily hydrolase
VYAEPQNQEAKDLLADVFEQIGYQQESPSVRNSFLAGALELRSGIPSGASPKSFGPDLIKAMATSLWLDFLGVRLDSEKADGIDAVINFVTPDNGEQFVVELSNGVLNSIQGFQDQNPDLTITINRADLEPVMMGVTTFDSQIDAGKATLVGDRAPYDKLKAMLDTFSVGFEILPGTGGTVPPQSQESPFAQPQPADTSGG